MAGEMIGKIMSKTDKYFQVSLSNGTGREVSYIEERGAKVGSQVELGGKGTGDFWTVDNVSDKFLFGHQLKDLQDNYREGFNSIKPRIAKAESL